MVLPKPKANKNLVCSKCGLEIGTDPSVIAKHSRRRCAKLSCLSNSVSSCLRSGGHVESWPLPCQRARELLSTKVADLPLNANKAVARWT